MPKSADFILGRLHQGGIHRILGCSGGGSLSMLGAPDRANGGPELIRPRHAEMGAFMATARAEFTASAKRTTKDVFRAGRHDK